MFKKSRYYEDIYGGVVEPSLVLSNPSSSDLIIVVCDTEGTATGEYYSIWIN